MRRAAATSRGEVVTSGATLMIRHGEQTYALTVSPLRAACGMVSSRRPAVALFVTDRKPTARVQPGILQTQFGLSRAEARLAAELLAGETLAQAGITLCVSINTVRTQLRAIFAKTGTERQADLVRLLMPTVLISAPD
ncbi:MAG: helix-turn-helix transcriptional regulator [Gammaproteobacteria bacterium]